MSERGRKKQTVRIIACVLLCVFCGVPCLAAERSIGSGGMERIGAYGYIDWPGMRLLAKGTGVIPAGESKTRGRIMGERAAILDARRNLLEVVKEVYVDSHTRVVDFITQSDVVVNEIFGVLQRPTIERLENKEEQGVVEALLSMPLEGKVGKALTKHASTEDTTAHAVLELPVDVEHSGLVVDARGTGFQPTLQPRLYCNGEVVFPPNSASASPTYARYQREENHDIKFSGDNPLRTKAQGLHSGQQGTLEITESAAAVVRGLAQKHENEAEPALGRSHLVIIF